jgi:hypothetical protein
MGCGVQNQGKGYWMNFKTAEPSRMGTGMERWWISWTFLGVYLATFQLWMHLSRPLILTSGFVVVAALLALMVWGGRSGYFVNRWDAFGHGMVVADLALEAILIHEHDHRGFYLCALAFALVVGGYRWGMLRRNILRVPIPQS